MLRNSRNDSIMPKVSKQIKIQKFQHQNLKELHYIKKKAAYSEKTESIQEPSNNNNFLAKESKLETLTKLLSNPKTAALLKLLAKNI